VADEEWQRRYVQRVLGCHNQNFGTDIALVGRIEDVYPARAGQRTWDWVCKDEASGSEAAVEVKKLTDEQREEANSVLGQIERDLSSRLDGILPGTFELSVSIGADRPDPCGARKRQLLEAIEKLIRSAAQPAEIGKEQNLAEQLAGQLRHVLPQDCQITLVKLENEGSRLIITGLGQSWFGAGDDLTESEFENFQRHVQKANEQLAEAARLGISETFLIILEIGFSGAAIDAVRAAFQRVASSSYCHIRHVYFTDSKSSARLGGTYSLN